MYISWATYIHSTSFRHISWKSTTKLSMRLCIFPAVCSTKILKIISFLLLNALHESPPNQFEFITLCIGKLVARKRTEAPQKKKKNRIQCRTKVLKVFVLGTLTGEGPWVRASFSVSKPFDRVFFLYLLNQQSEYQVSYKLMCWLGV
jgi:hypothetical protein